MVPLVHLRNCIACPPFPSVFPGARPAAWADASFIALAAEQPSTSSKSPPPSTPPNHPRLGKDAGTLAGTNPVGVALTATLAGNPDVIIDFSAPVATRALLKECVERKIALLIGTTGLTPADQQLIDHAAVTIPILQATNTSLGVNVLLSVAAQIARQLGEAYDIEIVEAHHNLKKDAPSGTALSLAESICDATGRSTENDLVHGREGHETLRKKGTIGMHAVRMGDVVGEHTIYYATPGERIELRHVATNRDTFARGALRAATFLAQTKKLWPLHHEQRSPASLTSTQSPAATACEVHPTFVAQTQPNPACTPRPLRLYTHPGMLARKTVKLTSWPDPLIPGTHSKTWASSSTSLSAPWIRFCDEEEVQSLNDWLKRHQLSHEVSPAKGRGEIKKHPRLSEQLVLKSGGSHDTCGLCGTTHTPCRQWIEGDDTDSIDYPTPARFYLCGTCVQTRMQPHPRLYSPADDQL